MTVKENYPQISNIPRSPTPLTMHAGQELHAVAVEEAYTAPRSRGKPVLEVPSLSNLTCRFKIVKALEWSLIRSEKMIP